MADDTKKDDLAERVERIERHLWPPGGPTDPSLFERKLDALDERLEAIQNTYVTRRELDDFKRIVAELRTAIARPDSGKGELGTA